VPQSTKKRHLGSVCFGTAVPLSIFGLLFSWALVITAILLFVLAALLRQNTRIFAYAREYPAWISCFLVTVLLALVLINIKGNLVIGEKSYVVKLPILVKFVALIERQQYFKVWIEDVIAPGVDDPEEKIDRIFEHLVRFPGLSEDFKKTRPLPNIEQHEYYTLIKQYTDNPSDIERVFCLLVTIAGYQAIPFKGEDDGRIVVRIPNSDPKSEKWKFYDFRNKVSNGEVKGIALTENVKGEVRSIETYWGKLLKGKYTRGDKNVPSRRLAYEVTRILGARFINAMNNERLL